MIPKPNKTSVELARDAFGGQTPRDAFVALLKRGFWPIVIYPKGVQLPDRITEGKEPIGKAWGVERWTLEKADREYGRHVEAGVGICLGPGRALGGAWLVDVEGDGPEAEASRVKLFKGESIESPGWDSARGGHLLLTCESDRLATIMPRMKALESKDRAGSGVYKSPELPGLELRIGGYTTADRVKQVQSVVPPTPGTNGLPRVWTGPATIAPAPDAFYETLEKLASRPKATNQDPFAGKASNRSYKRADVIPENADQEARKITNYVRMALADEAAKVASTPIGGRHDALLKASINMAGLIKGANFSEDTFRRVLAEAADLCDLPAGEAADLIESALEKATPRDLTKARGWKPEGNDRPPLRIVRSNGHHQNSSNPSDASDTSKVARPTVEEGSSGELPKIVISTDEFLVNNQAIAAMTADPEVFCRGNFLVTVHRDAASTKLITRPPESPRISALQKASIRERISKNAEWFKWRKHPDGEGMVQAPAHPPDWATAAIEARGHWPGMRPLEGVIESPVLLPDGSILDQPGYDDRSGLLYEPNCGFPPIPSQITRDDASKSARDLLEVVADFPFAIIRDEEGDGTDAGDGGMGHRAAFLAGLLTPLARYAIAGPCPLFLVDANVAASGKSKLCDIVAILATGRMAARSSYSESNEEMEKRILSIALEGDRMILLDNIATGAALGGAALDAALTATTVKGRLLGRSQMTREIPIYTVWYATGNNLGLKGDALRRVIPYRLESPEERPEERRDFRIKENLLDYVRRERGRLVVAALTILRGYVLAGRPVTDLTPMDYPDWCNTVRQAVYWALGVDPCSTRIGLINDDPETNLIKGLFQGWSELPRGTTGLTTAEVVRILTNPDHMDKYHTIREVLLEWSRDGGIPSPKSIGRQLRMFKGRIVDGKTLKAVSVKGTQSWRIDKA